MKPTRNTLCPREGIRTLTIPRDIGASVPSGLGYGTAPYGSTPYGGAASTVPELDLTVDVGLIGTNARALLSGAGHIHIRGVEWHLAPKPLRRATVMA